MTRKIVLIASLVAGLLAALLTRVYITAKEDDFARMKARFHKEYGEMEAICFNKDMPSGTVVTAADLGTCVTFSKWGDDVLTQKDRLDVIGARTAGARKRNVPLRRSYIEGGEHRRHGLSSITPKDLRAVSINVTGASSVSGMIRPGDSVDVIGTFDFPDDDGKIKRGDPVTCTILQKVLVLATGNDTAKSIARGGLGTGREGGYSLVTLAVTPREAEMLAFAEQIRGRLMLTLRRFDDLVTEEDLPTVNFSKIREEIEDLNKIRNPQDRKPKRR